MTYFTGEVKPFCPCDVNEPQDCKPEQWGDAHKHRDCTTCGKPSYQHGRDSEGRWVCPT